MDNRVKCNSCGKIYEFDYRKKHTGNCIYCHSGDTEFVTKLPLIYHPRQFVQWPLEFKKQRYTEILGYLKNEYRHRCAMTEESGECVCREKDFQKELIDHFIDFYEPLFIDLPFGLKTIRENERLPLGQAIAVMEERPLWSPGEAITWYRHLDENHPHHSEDTFFKHTGASRKGNIMTDLWKGDKGSYRENHRIRKVDRLRGRIDIDIFNVAIELKVFRNQLSVRDLLAECMRDKIVADDFVIGVLIGFPTIEELEMYPDMEESERNRLNRIIQENLHYHQYLFEEVNIPLVLL